MGLCFMLQISTYLKLDNFAMYYSVPLHTIISLIQSMSSPQKPVQQTVSAHNNEQSGPALKNGRSRQHVDINAILLENSEILAELSMEGRVRRNKNIMNARMCMLVNRLERNIIKMAKNTNPDCVGDPHHIQAEKNRFINFYKQRNGAKK